MAALTDTEIQRRSRQFAVITAGLALIIIAAFAITMVSALTGPAADRPELTVLYLVYWSPTLFYLWALSAVRKTFRDIGQGSMFGSTIARGLRHIGWALLMGGTINSIIIHVVQSAYVPDGFSTGETHAFRGLKFDPAYIMLILTALALLLLSRLIAAAANEHERANRLETELGEFL
ncbi:DUF2975 domain-containing protein [Qipengyuania atrilutea]|uniref:DUF2975 domain-containing protein n=1 Tax=Qipengyuania atrilutea TaxID=2744473 RepID=A0A850H7W4_9SPHN|nr:DUF2975 domain-containing protein [Actirhodobacter atriluteus]NVD45315.1 hypothetical protein [Actirhodobacter atriluteus]